MGGEAVRYTSEDAIAKLPYVGGIVAELMIARWLLMNASDYNSTAAWLAYALFTSSAGVTIYGLVWFWAWFAERGALAWYVVIMSASVPLASALFGFLIGNRDAIASGLALSLLPPAAY